MKFIDAAPIAGTRRTSDGWLIAEARCVRTGIQLYAGDEVGRPDLDVVRVYRGPDQVFARDSLQSFSHAPITIDHPAEPVTEANWRDLAVGEVSTAAKQDGEWIMLPLVLKDGKAIAAVESGKRQLSAGYVCELDWTPGETADGQAFDAQQKGIKVNHLALVDRARAGPMARIGDGADDGGKDRATWGASPLFIDRKDVTMADAVKTRTVLIDGLSVETTDQGAQALEKLMKDKDAIAAKLSDAEAAHKAAIDAKDTEIGTLKADLKTAQDAAKIDVDKLVADRAELVETVKTIDAKIETAGKSDADLRKAAVAAKLGDEMVKDASEAEILGMFKAVAKDTKADPVADAIRSGIKPTATDAASQAAKALSDSVTDLNAWRYQKEA